MDQATLDKLYEGFELRERKGLGGMTFKYIPSNSIIDRMNKVFGGNWATEVQSQEIVEDSVLLRVNVRVWDGENWYSHEGYGSSSFKRFTSGMNQGKIVDVGNAYKAALSMGIRNACTKFGCGLYIEGDPEAHDVGTAGPSFTPPNIPSSVPPSAPSAPPVDNTPKPPVQENNLPPVPPPPTAPAVQNTPPPPPASPQAPTQPSLPPVPPPSTAPQTQNTPSAPPTQPQVFGQPQGDVMSSVQEAALDALVSIKGLNYDTLVSEALTNAGIKFDSIPTKDQLKGSEATVVIKYGNDKARR